MEQEFIHGGGKGEMGRHVGRSSALLNRNGLGHHQSAPKRHPEEQQITREDKIEGEMGAKRREEENSWEDPRGMWTGRKRLDRHEGDIGEGCCNISKHS